MNATVVAFTGHHCFVKPGIMRLDMATENSIEPADSETSLEMTDAEMAAISEMMRAEIEDGSRKLPDWYYEEYQEEDLSDIPYDTDDPNAIDAETLGVWDESDYEIKIEHEFDIAKGDPDPNALNPRLEHLQKLEVDEDGIEVGFDPINGQSNPIDERTILNPMDSYMVDDLTRNDTMVKPIFPEGDLEIALNKDVTAFRKSLRIIETYVDPYLQMEVPSDIAKWHGYPEKVTYDEKPDHINRFTDPKDMTDFDALGPAKARVKALEMARSKNCEWLPKGKSIGLHNARTNIYKERGLLVGSTLKGEIDEEVRENIQPALKILGSVVKLLETNGTVFRFHYYGLIKNKRGMAAWTETLIRDCGVECTGVVFETGWRKRDPLYDKGDNWHGPY